ncbi:MAG: rRNA maturation RNase YbeY [Flavobacteriales bacterium]
MDFQFDEIKKTSVWINKIISNYSKISGDLTYIFCSDTYLLQLNISHLNHDTLTDIITFDYTNAGIISGDIFISIDRIKENASTFGVPFEEELSRVMAHGVLHLIGFKDKTKDEKQEMREAEDHALTLVVS